MGSSAAGRPTTPIRTSFRAGGAIGGGTIGGRLNGCATAAAPPETHVRTIASVSASPLADMPFLIRGTGGARHPFRGQRYRVAVQNLLDERTNRERRALECRGARENEAA